MSYRVCIPTAGLGSRLGNLSKYLNKSLVAISNRPILSHIIEQFPDDAEFVIALGYKGNLVREFLELAYPQRKFFFAEVHPFEGPESGLGLSLLACKEFLQQPFIFSSCDTLVKESIPAPTQNWVGYAQENNSGFYRAIKVVGDIAESICEKTETKTTQHKPYIGLVGIFDYKKFWSAMELGGKESIETGEAYGMKKIIDSSTKVHEFTWYDTGNPAALEKARQAYKNGDNFNILEKENEAIWFIKNRVIKFSADEKFIANRVARSKELQDFIPKMIGAKRNMYSYEMVQGTVLSESVNLPLFDDLLKQCKKFWKVSNLTPAQKEIFDDKCMSFYRTKTFERVELFYKNFGQADGEEKINGVAMPKLSLLLNSLDWNWVAKGLPGRFHGDFHFENIIINSDKKTFTFLDWRQDFGGDLSVGDLYYDLAKLLHGLIINHGIITENLFEIEWKKDKINYDFNRKQILVDCENYFYHWLEKEGYDKKKVSIMTALIYLNIAALHHHPYSLLLYALGKSMLFNELQNNEHH